MSYAKKRTSDRSAESPEFAAEFETARILAQLVQLREEAGLTQADIAERLGISQPRVNQIERQRNVPRLDVVVRLAQSVGAEIVIRKGIPPQSGGEKPSRKRDVA